uniref:H-type lectin domain-containing protein n=1 Tax=Magallana gigas TaxID=29159 RepID=A0A8W8L1S7_MAGGI
MGLIAEVLLLVTAVAIAGTVQSQNSNVERQNRSGNELVFYLMEQLYDMKPKIETMKTKIKDMEFYIAAQKKQIEALQNRESGVVVKYANPPPSWPYIQSVKFKSHFEERPTVTYGLYFLDSDRSTNLRVITEITDVTKTGFRMKLTSYDDSKLYGAKINWMACGK